MRVLSATSTIYLHVKQTEGTETANVSFDLGAATMEYGNNSTFFQWGRKDPMPPSTGLANAKKSIYGTYSTIVNMSTTDISATIRSPYCYNTSDGNSSLELWNVGNTVTTVNVNPIVKSIYDPSPAGFHVPCSGAFQGWGESGRFYWQSTAGKQGYYIYQLGVSIGNPILFQAFGDWSSGGIGYVGLGGGYWTAGPAATSHGRYLDVYNGGFNPENSISRSHAYVVRPAAE